MGRNSKKTLGGAASGAAAGTSIMPGWGTAIGAAAGGLLGSMDNEEPAQLPPVVAQDIIEKLYSQSQGGTPTIGELKGAQMMDKTLAQQIAAARAQRGVNPALLQRNVSRIAAEQSQANAQSAAILAADERNKAMAQYMQARALNAGVEAKNLGFEQAADAQANNMMGAGLNSFAGALALGAQKNDAAGELGKAATAAKSDAIYNDTMRGPQTPVQSTTGGASLGFQMPDYSMGALAPQTSDKNSKTKIKSEDLVVVSDERQKELISSESLPTNNNLNMQNQTAAAPQAQMQMQAPPTQQQQTAQPAQATPQASVPAPQFGVTSEMLQKAQNSSKQGGNISDIQNKGMTLQRGAEGPSAQEILAMSMDAQRRQKRDVFGNVTQSDAENYQANLGRWYAARDAQNAAYEKEAGQVQEANAINDAQRTNRLNRFYTGVDTGGAALAASQYAAPKAVLPGSDWGSAQQAQNAAGIGNQSNNNGWSNFTGHISELVNNPYGAAALGGAYGLGAQQLANNSGIKKQISDENLKTGKNAEGSADFNPKSFLDKLQAYSYEYKKGAKGMPGAGEGRHLSVMAQDLEKAGPVGRSMVQEDEQGNKSVDYGKGFGAILASQAQLNERLSQIEKQYPKKKKEA